MDNFKFNLKKDMEVQIKVFDSFATLKNWSFSERCAQMILSSPEALKSRLCSINQVPESTSADLYAKFKATAITFGKPSMVIEDPYEYIKAITINPGESVRICTERLKEVMFKVKDYHSPKGVERTLFKKVIATSPESHRDTLELMDGLTLDSLIEKVEKLRLTPKTMSENVIQSKIDSGNPLDRSNKFQKGRPIMNSWAKCGGQGNSSKDCRGDSICQICKKKGHTQNICRSTESQQYRGKYNYPRNSVTETNEYKDDSLVFDQYFDSDYTVFNIYNNKFFKSLITARIVTDFGVEIDALIDTGSVFSIIRRDQVTNFQPSSNLPNLSCANGLPIKILGLKDITLKISEIYFKHFTLVADSLYVPAIIGMDFLKKHNININTKRMEITLVNPDKKAQSLLPTYTGHSLRALNIKIDMNLGSCQKNSLNRILNDYQDIFAKHSLDLGLSRNTVHRIETDSQILTYQQLYRIPKSLEKEVTSILNEMEKIGIIRPSKSQWRSPVTLPLKKDGTRKFCVDYRKLNSVTKKDVYPLPCMDVLLNRIGGSTYFSKIDLKRAYWQVPIHLEDIEKTAFSIGPRWGIFEFVVMPFGISNAPATCQRMMDITLSKLSNTCCYLDDIIIFSKSWEDHLRHIKETLSALKGEGLKIRKNKCSFGMREIKFLGYDISERGLSIDKEKTFCFLSWKSPSNKKELQCFLGACNYYQKFIENLSGIAEPLYRLIRKDSKFSWDNACENSFLTLRKALRNLPTLKFPTDDLPIILETDASNVALGAKISQDVCNNNHTIMYASRLLKRSEKNYSATDKNFLAIIWSLKRFRCYLLGKKFIIRTDHNPLSYLSNSNNNHNKRERWLELLSEFNFKIEYILGKDNVVSNALSRSPEMVSITNMNQMLELQTQDHDIRIIMNYLNGINNNIDQLTEFGRAIFNHRERLILSRDGLLLYRRTIKRVVVGKTFSIDIMKSLHVLDCGHSGPDKMFKFASQHFFWPNMRSDIEKYVACCLICLNKKVPNKKTNVSSRPLPICYPFKNWHLDFVGPLPPSSKGNRFILIMIDRFTKWCEAVPTNDQSAEFVSSCIINNIVVRFGIPDTIHSYQGLQFESILIRDLCEYFGTLKSRWTAYHPEGNGQAERYVKSLKLKIKALILENNKDWEENLPLALMSLRRTNY